ncbi:MAG: alkyldihydroxyacetonephosphate synthase [Frankiales bacterium]|nr:alkyldihydroxyacetonephosphate synthase [Frankiales bacterium]
MTQTPERASHRPEWDAWGSADQRPVLGEEARRFLRATVGEAVPQQPVGITSVVPEPSRLGPEAHAALVAAVGPDQVRTDDDSRLRRAGGQSYVDLIRRRSGSTPAPDAVVLVSSDAEVLAVLRACGAHDVAVVPFGGGTSVVGGVEPLAGAHRAVISLDLERLSSLIDVDPLSLTATVGAGMTTPALEAALSRHGLTLGHAPQSWQRATIGGYVVTRSAGQASTGIGRFDELVLGLTLVTPSGVMELPALPGSASGPDLRRLVMGSEGTLGVVTRVQLRVRRLPAQRRFEGWAVPSFEAGREAFRALVQAGTTADVMRLSDEVETRVALELTGPRGWQRGALDRYLGLRLKGDPCLVILGFEGDGEDVAHRRKVVTRVLRAAGGEPLGRRAGRSWEHGRFAGPHLRDSLMDAGYLVETLETAALWAGLDELHAGVRDAVTAALAEQGTQPVVGCHVSHVYGVGASLYFTVIARRVPGGETAQWGRAKEAANAAIAAAGAAATHHHGVGTMHRGWVRHELSALGLDALAAVKGQLDPHNVLNPGKLLGAPGDGG